MNERTKRIVHALQVFLSPSKACPAGFPNVHTVNSSWAVFHLYNIPHDIRLGRYSLLFASYTRASVHNVLSRAVTPASTFVYHTIIGVSAHALILSADKLGLYTDTTSLNYSYP